LVVAGYLGSLGVMTTVPTKNEARVVRLSAILFAVGWIIGGGFVLASVSGNTRWLLGLAVVPFVAWRCFVWVRAAQAGRYPSWRDAWLPWRQR